MNHSVLPQLHPEQVEVEIGRADELEVRSGLSSELDEMWSYVRRKANPRWLWHAIDHHTGTVLAYVFGRRQDTVFLELKALLEPFGIADKNFKGLFLPRHLVSAPAGSALGQGAERWGEGWPDRSAAERGRAIRDAWGKDLGKGSWEARGTTPQGWETHLHWAHIAAAITRDALG